MADGFATIPKTQQELEKLDRLRAWLRGMFVPTLNYPAGWAGEGSVVPAEMPTIYLHPKQEGSRMPRAEPSYLNNRSRTGGPGGPA